MQIWRKHSAPTPAAGVEDPSRGGRAAGTLRWHPRGACNPQRIPRAGNGYPMVAQGLNARLCKPSDGTNRVCCLGLLGAKLPILSLEGAIPSLDHMQNAALSAAQR